MTLENKKFQASNGRSVEFFQSQDLSNKRAHVIWFSAFTHGPLLGKILKTEQRFHGFKAAKSFDEFGFTLIRDDAGLTNDGSYYYGKATDPYIELATSELVQRVKEDVARHGATQPIIAIGSSMGAYGAVKFALMQRLDAAFALVPHFELVAAGQFCGRKPWIDWVREGATESAQSRFMSRLQTVLAEAQAPLPRLFVQSAEDDLGVHKEQVLPFVEAYSAKSRNVITDFRKTGGHSMVNASNEYIHDVLELLVDGREFTPGMFDGYPRRQETTADKIERVSARIENAVGRSLRAVGLMR